MRVLKGADTIDEAVNQFYENPDKYSHGPDSTMSKPVTHTKDPKMQVHSPPPQYPPTETRTRLWNIPHTNAVIEAGNLRARDEVHFTLTTWWR